MDGDLDSLTDEADDDRYPLPAQRVTCLKGLVDDALHRPQAREELRKHAAASAAKEKRDFVDKAEAVSLVGRSYAQAVSIRERHLVAAKLEISDFARKRKEDHEAFTAKTAAGREKFQQQLMKAQEELRLFELGAASNERAWAASYDATAARLDGKLAAAQAALDKAREALAKAPSPEAVIGEEDDGDDAETHNMDATAKAGKEATATGSTAATSTPSAPNAPTAPTDTRALALASGSQGGVGGGAAAATAATATAAANKIPEEIVVMPFLPPPDSLLPRIPSTSPAYNVSKQYCSCGKCNVWTCRCRQPRWASQCRSVPSSLGKQIGRGHRAWRRTRCWSAPPSVPSELLSPSSRCRRRRRWQPRTPLSRSFAGPSTGKSRSLTLFPYDSQRRLVPLSAMAAPVLDHVPL